MQKFKKWILVSPLLSTFLYALVLLNQAAPTVSQLKKWTPTD